MTQVWWGWIHLCEGGGWDCAGRLCSASQVPQTLQQGSACFHKRPHGVSREGAIRAANVQFSEPREPGAEHDDNDRDDQGGRGGREIRRPGATHSEPASSSGRADRCRRSSSSQVGILWRNVCVLCVCLCGYLSPDCRCSV